MQVLILIVFALINTVWKTSIKDSKSTMKEITLFLDLQVVITEYILGSRASRMPASLPPRKPKHHRSRFSPREGPLRIIEGIFHTAHMHPPDNPDAFLFPGIMKEVVSVV